VPGPPGNAATIAIGTTTTGAAGSSAQVVNVGSSSAAIFNFIIPQGIPGQAAAATLTVYGETPVGAIDGVNKDFTTAYAYSPTLIGIFLNGLRLKRIDDYRETGANSFQLISAPLVGDILCADYTRA
jgi:hypothetical protein